MDRCFRKLTHLKWSVCAVSALQACTDVSRVPVPDVLATTQVSFASDLASDAPSVAERWWRDFGSDELTDLIDRLVAQNPDLAAASLRVRQAQFELGNAQTSLRPTATAGASATAISSEASGARDATANGDISLSVSWEADLWGRVQGQVDASTETLRASLYDREALAASLIANVMRSYITVAFVQREIAATRRIVATRRTSLTVVQDRFQRGVEATAAGNVKSAEENLAAAQADLPRLELSLIEATNAVDVLTGQVPRSRPDLKAALLQRLPKLNVSGTPARLLDQRPDIQAAAARLRAANANIKVSVADRFPALTLTGSLTSNGANLGDVLDPSSIVASLVSALTLTVFDGGRGSRLVAIRTAQAEELAQAYVSAVLNAIGEVEDRLAAETYLARQSHLLNKRLTAARAATQIARDRFRDGTGDFLTLLDASRSEASAETAFLAVERSRWFNRVDLMLALGGRWVPLPEAGSS